MARAEQPAAAASAAAAAIPTKINVSLLLPHKVLENSVPADLVILPGAAGVFGVGPQHQAIIAELKPGVISIYGASGAADTRKDYFVAGGFARVPEGGATLDVSSPEAVPLSEIDRDAVSRELQKLKDQLAAAATDEDRAKAQIGVEVYEALDAALQA